MVNEKNVYFFDDAETTIRELKQLVVGFEEIVDIYSNNLENKENHNIELNKKIFKLQHKINDLEQNISLLKEIESVHASEIQIYQNRIESIEKDVISKNNIMTEIKNENNTLRTNNELLQKNNYDLNLKYQEAKNVIQKYKHMLSELEQEHAVTKELRDSLEKEHIESEEVRKEYQEKFENERMQKSEKIQESILLEEQKNIETEEKKIIIKKYYKAITVSIIVISIITGAYSLMFAQLAGENYKIQEIKNMPTGYTIQNLRGDKVNTWITWRLMSGDSLKVNILNADMYSKEKIDVIKNAILKEDSIKIDNSLLHKGLKGTTSEYYLGWEGALKKAAERKTEFTIPTELEVFESKKGEGDVTIELINAIHPDGFSGWTSAIVDESQNQILKSRVTIYNFDKLSNAEIETIVRHEFGHVVGLAHSTAPEDLMAPTIETNYPYISGCDIDAIRALYDGAKKSEVLCEI